MQPRFDTPPKITLSITNTCNLECAHCYGHCTKTAAGDELSTAEVLAFIDYLVANDFIQIYIEGGEPQCRNDFDQIVEHCGRSLMTLVRTHGTLLTQETARRWHRSKVGRVYVDLMGASAQTHERLTGVPGTFEKSCNAVRYLVDAGVDTDMLIILNRHNVDELNDYLQLAKSLGATRVGILRLYPLGRAKQRWSELALSAAEQDAAIYGLNPPAGLGVMQSWHPKDKNCCWQAAAVTAFGDSVGCMYLREYVNHGNIRDVPFLDTWHHAPLYKALRSGVVDHDAKCSGCNVRSNTLGGCRSTAFAFHGRWDAPDPFCRTLNRGVDLRVLPERLLREDS